MARPTLLQLLLFFVLCVRDCYAQNSFWFWDNSIHLKGSIGVADELVYALSEKQMLAANAIQNKLPDAPGFFDHLPISTAIAQTKTGPLSGGFDLSIPRKAVQKDGNLVIVAHDPFGEGRIHTYWLVHIPPDTELKEVDLEEQTLLSKRRTVNIAGYEAIFPANTPEGYKVTYSYIKRTQGRTQRVAAYSYHNRAIGGIELTVYEYALAGVDPNNWQTLAKINPERYLGDKIPRTSAGIKEVAGLKFAVTHWAGEESGSRYSGMDYLARDGDKLVRLSAYTNQDDRYMAPLLESILSSLRKVKS